MPDTHLVTADELFEMGEGRCELVQGRLIELKYKGFFYGRVGMKLMVRVWESAHEGQLGEVFPAETGFQIETDPDTVLAPTCAFVTKERLRDVDTRGYLPLAPDLAVEVAGPTDPLERAEEKAAMWLSFGSRLVWVVEPDLRMAFVYRPDSPREEIGEDGTLSGEDVLPGLVIPLADCL